MRNPDGSVFRRDLVTSVRHLSYDFSTRTGVLTMPEYCCTDMSGAIKLFRGIDPHVKRIETVAGEIPDTLYVRDREHWTAVTQRNLPPREGRPVIIAP